MATHQGIRIHQYLDDWLVRARSHHICLQHTQILVKVCQDLGWVVNIEKSELEPKQVFDFVGYQFDLRSGRVRPMADPSRKDSVSASTTGLSSPAVHVLDRSVNSHREASSPRLTPHETHTVASQKQLENTRIPRKGDPNSQVTAPASTMVATKRQRSYRPVITPYKTCSADIYRRIKRRVGRSLKRTHCKRILVPSGKQAAHKLPGVKNSLFSSKRFSRPLHPQYSTCGNRQHYSSVLHKQGGRHEVGPTLCPSMENLDLVYQTPSDAESPSHPRSTECGSRQAIPPRPDHSNRMVPPSRGFSSFMQQVALAQNRSIRHEVQQQITSVCVTSSGPAGSSSGCTQFPMGGSGCLCLPTDSHFGQSSGEVAGFSMQENHPDCPWMAQHALVLGPSDHVQSGPSEPAQPSQPVNTAVQSDPSQKSDKSKSPCMVP